MQIELTPGEARELAQALDRQLEELMNELVHTDDREYRESVRRSIDTLEAVRVRFGPPPLRR